jgi:transposase InsO family protein
MKLTGINQLWVADITYVRLKAEFVYLVVILDGCSRKVVGWALDRTLGMRLTIGALEQANCASLNRMSNSPSPS